MELLSSLLKAFYLRKHEQTFIFLCADFETVHTNVYISFSSSLPSVDSSSL